VRRSNCLLNHVVASGPLLLFKAIRYEMDSGRWKGWQQAGSVSLDALDVKRCLGLQEVAGLARCDWAGSMNLHGGPNPCFFCFLDERNFRASFLPGHHKNFRKFSSQNLADTACNAVFHPYQLVNWLPNRSQLLTCTQSYARHLKVLRCRKLEHTGASTTLHASVRRRLNIRRSLIPCCLCNRTCRAAVHDLATPTSCADGAWSCFCGHASLLMAEH
jgi:hypothetical protein